MRPKKPLHVRLWSSLAMMVCSATLAVFGFSACEEEPKYGYGEKGNYYYETASNDEYSMTLQNGAITLSMNGAEYEGSYEFDGSTMSMAFPAESGVTFVSYNDGVVTVKIGGETVKFLSSKVYTVTFNSNGGSAVAADYVKNGQTAEKPVDPVLNGYNFIGWYADSEFKTPYNFQVPVTGNITVYARFEKVVVGQNEYTVTLNNDGKETQVPTIGGVAYDLPTPEKEGATFLGWWTSDYEDESKLTAQYAGEVLNENTTLYAVWKSEDAAVSVTSAGVKINYTGANASYKVEVKAPNVQYDYKTTTGESVVSYDFATKPAGDYVVKVTVNGKTTTAYYKNKALDRVSLFEVVDPSVLVYNTVANAEKYVVDVVCGNELHNHTSFDNGASTYYNFADCAMSVDGIKFVVTAVADGYASSTSSEFVYKRELSAVANLTVAGDVVVWDRVEKATSYEVSVTVGNDTYTKTVSSTNFSIKEYTGELTIKVTPVTKGYFATSTEITYNKTTLASPKLAVDGNVVTWNDVGAEKYVVKFNAQEYEVTEGTEFEIVDTMYDGTEDEFVVSVMAVAADEANNSSWSDAVVIKYVALKVKYNAGTVSWNSVFQAESYKVFVNGVAVATLNKDVVSYPVTLTQKGVNTIAVSYLDSHGGTVATSEDIEVYAYEVSFNAQGGADVETVYKAVGDEFVLPTSEKTGYGFAGWYNVPGGASSNGAQYVDKYFVNGGDMMLFAQWSPNKYQVTLVVDKESEATEEDVFFRENYQLSQPVSADVTKVFGGWFTKRDGAGEQYTDAEGLSKAPWQHINGLKLYAHWIEVLKFNEIDNGNAYSVSKGLNISQVKSVKIPAMYNDKPVTTIEGSAFMSCTNLTKVEIPDTIELISIGVNGGSGQGSPFYNCTNMKEIAFYCPDEVNHDGHECDYEVVDGVLLYHNQFNGVELKYVPQGIRGSFVVPSSVTTIPTNTFYNTRLTEVIIPASVTQIDASAFATTINGAYGYLESVVFLPSEDGFEKPLTIDKSAFVYSRYLRTVTLPARLQSFDVSIFSNCNMLAEINIDGEPVEDGIVYKAVDGAIVSANGKTLVYMPKGRVGEITLPNTVTEIGDRAFEDCLKITKVTIGMQVSKIGESAFEGCSALKEVEFLGTETDLSLNIGKKAFYDCAGLTELVLPENLGAVAQYAFGNDKNLTKVELNGANADLAKGAFASDTEIPEYYVRNLTIGKNVKSFEIAGVFGGTSLREVTVKDGNEAFWSDAETNVVYNKEKTAILFYPYTREETSFVVPDRVTTIGSEVFRGKPRLSSIEIGKDVTTIGDYAFYGSTNLTTVTFTDGGTEDLTIGKNAFDSTGVTTLDLPERLVAVGDYAFANTGISTVSFSDRVTSIGATDETLYTVFSGCSSLASVAVDEDNEKYVSLEDMLFIKDGEDVVLYLCPSAKEGVAVFPDNLGSIAKNALNNCTKITGFQFGSEVTDKTVLPVGLTEIFDGMFAYTAITSITIPYTVTKIGYGAFYGCEQLEEIIFTPTPDGETEVPLEFVGMSSVGLISGSKITEFVFPERTNKIGQGLFMDAYALERVVFPKDVETMDTANMFYNSLQNLAALNEIVFPETGMTTVGSMMFINCPNLTTLNNLPDTVTTFDTFSIQNTGITEITIPANCTTCNRAVFVSTPIQVIRFADNAQMPETGMRYMFYQLRGQWAPQITKFLNIPATWKKLPDLFASNFYFSNMPLEEVTFAEGSMLQEIEASVFASSTFESFEFPETYAVNENGYIVSGSLKLGANMFSNNKNLKSVKLSSTISSVAGVFTGVELESLTIAEDNPYLAVHETLPIIMNVEIDGDGNVHTPTYFSVYKNLDLTATDGVLTIPEGVKTISSNTFAGQTGIKKVVLPASLETLGDNAFSGCSNLTQVQFNTATTNGLLVSIGNSAFAGTAITSIAIPDSVTDFGTAMFNGCASLTSATLPTNLAKIPAQTFMGCTALKSFELPELITEIGENAFEGSGISTFTWNSSLTTIGSSAFKDCDSLLTIVIPSTVQSIGTGLFENCDSLTGATLPSAMEALPASTFKGCSSLTSYTLPTNLTVIGQSAFENSAVATVTWNTLLTTIGVDSFKNTKLTKVENLPATVTTISRGAFRDCLLLTEVTIPTGVTALYGFGTSLSGVGQFEGCTALNKVTFHENFVEIAGQVFRGTTNLKSIDLPDSLRILGFYAFRESGLESITIPKNVTEIGSQLYAGASGGDGGTFSGSANLKTVTYEGTITKIWKYSFDGTAVTDFDALVPETVTEIGDYAFRGSKITSATIKAGITYGTSLFSGCTELKDVTFDDTLTSLPSNMFSGCTSLTSVELPASLEAIPSSFFSGCTNLREIVLPSNVETIGYSAFRNCYGLTSITLPSGLASIGDGAFENCYRLVEIINNSNLTITAGATANGYIGQYAKAVHTGATKVSTDENGFVTYTDGEATILVDYVGDLTEIVVPDYVTEVYEYALYNKDVTIAEPEVTPEA